MLTRKIFDKATFNVTVVLSDIKSDLECHNTAITMLMNKTF